MNIKAVLFDLDGTFADTAPDLAYALNKVLKAQGKKTLPFETIRPFVSKGAPGLIKLGFNLLPQDFGYESIREHFLSVYQQNICRKTRLFDGIERVIGCLETQHLKWGIVTNKPAFLTDPLMIQLKMNQRSSVTISGDSFKQKKPHPLPLLEACKTLAIEPEDCIYVGDDERDIQAARAAGMKSIAALWGYIPEHEDPACWKANWSIERSQDLFDCLFN